MKAGIVSGLFLCAWRRAMRHALSVDDSCRRCMESSACRTRRRRACSIRRLHTVASSKNSSGGIRHRQGRSLAAEKKRVVVRRRKNAKTALFIGISAHSGISSVQGHFVAIVERLPIVSEIFHIIPDVDGILPNHTSGCTKQFNDGQCADNMPACTVGVRLTCVVGH